MKAVLIFFSIISLGLSQTDATRRTKPELLNIFRDGQPRNSITPRNMRDFVESAMVGQFPSVTQFGAVGDNETDATAAIQDCIDSLPVSPIDGLRRGACFIPSGSYITSEPICLKSGVSLIGESSAFADLSTRIFGAGGSGGFPVLSDCGVQTNSVSVEKLALRGKNESGSRGIYAPTSPNAWRIRDVNFDWFGDECMKIGAHGTEGVDGLFESNYGQNCMLVRSGRTDYIGAFDFAVSDARILYNEVTASVYNPVAPIYPGEGLIGSGYIAAIVIRASNSLFYGNICQISEVGCVISGYGHNIVLGNRADLNQGAGFIIETQANSITNNHSYRNSRTGDGLHDGFVVTSDFNTFTDNRVSQCGPSGGVESCAVSDDGTAGKPRQGYAFKDSSDSTTPGANSENYYRGNRGSGLVDGLYDFSGTTQKRVEESAGDCSVVASTTSCLQEFINTASTTGQKVVTIPAGTYTTAAITVPVGMTVQGVGSATKLIPSTSSGKVFQMDNASVDGVDSGTVANSVIRDLQISGRTHTNNTAIGIYLRGQQYVSVQNVLFDEIDHGVFIDKCNSIKLKALQLVDNVTLFAGSTTSTQTYALSSNIQFDDISHKATDEGVTANVDDGRILIRLSRAINTSIKGFTNQNLLGRGIGLSLENDTQGTTLTGFAIVRPKNGIQLLRTTVGAATVSPSFNKIFGGTVDQYVVDGILMDDGTNMTSVYNVGLLSFTGGTQTAAIEVQPTSFGIQIYDNYFQNVLDGDGILVTGGGAGDGTHDIIIKNNFFWTGISDPDADIKIGGNVNGLEISGNRRSPLYGGTADFISNANADPDEIVQADDGAYQ